MILLSICAVSFSTVNCEAVVDASESGAAWRLFVMPESGTDEDGDLKVRLSVEGAAFCGIKAVISYDRDEVLLLDVVPDEGLTEQGGVLSFAESEGEIVIIVDFCENYAGGEIGSLIFEALGQEICFEAQVESVYFWEDDRLWAAEKPEKEKFSVVVQSPRGDGGCFGLTAEIGDDGDDAELTLRAIAPVRCFAAGFDLCVVELERLDLQSFSVSGVPSGSAAEERSFSHTVTLSAMGRYCIIVKPVAYFGSGTVTGREIVIFVDNGSLKN